MRYVDREPLVVKAVDSKSEGYKFESRHRILD